MQEKGSWTEKDEATIHAIIVNMINQKQMFQDLGKTTILPHSFNIKNNNEYILGLFTGIVINLFANYWVGEHESGLSPVDLSYLYYNISLFHEEIVSGLFD